MAVVTYVDRRDTLDRLQRVQVVGDTALGWLSTLDPTLVRMISDEDLARLTGGTYVPPIGPPVNPRNTYPSLGLYPYPGFYPSSTPDDGTFGRGTFGSGIFGR